MGMKKKAMEETAQGEAGRETADNHADRLAEHHEYGVIDDEAGDRHVSMHTILKQVSGHGIAESVEEIGANANEREVYPRLVVDEVGEGFQGEFLGPDRFQPFFGKEAAGQGAQGGKSAQHYAQNGILMRRRSTHHLLQIREGEKGDEAHCISAHHTERRELVAFVAVFGHYTQEGTVRHIHGRIDHHHQQIQGIRINPAARRAQIGRIQEQGKDHAQRNGAEDEPGPISAPAGLGAVGYGAHQRVRDYIEEARQQHQGSGIGHGEAEDVGEEKGKSDGHHLPSDTAGGGVTQAISDFL